MENQNTNQQADEEQGSEYVEKLIPLEKQEKLDELKKIALEKGLAKAVFVAKKMDDPFLLDELHDLLVDELKNHLVSEGKLENL